VFAVPVVNSVLVVDVCSSSSTPLYFTRQPAAFIHLSRNGIVLFKLGPPVERERSVGACGPNMSYN
jgi:hypothetical protein